MPCDFSHVIIGGGAVGLAIASRLVRRAAATNVLLIERNKAIGQETSSRNSEVVHAGLYYPKDGLKTKLCLRGKEMLYDLFDDVGIAYKKTGKWIVAQDEEQEHYLQGLKDKADSLDIPTHFISSTEAERVERLVKVGKCALVSSTTGIMDSHGLMTYLRLQFEDQGGDIAYDTSIKSIEAMTDGYRIQTRSGDEQFEVTAESVINSAGLGATEIANMLDPDRHKAYYAKGQYYSYSGPGPSRLVYPCPEKDLAGLGTHLTMDLQGAIRFGPDVEWVESVDYSTSSARLDDVYRAVQTYLPSIDRSKLHIDYTGIRPKLKPAGSEASDFYIQEDHPGFVNLLGIESPGLTSCLAIAEYVDKIV